jgi:hypothetical protein
MLKTSNLGKQEETDIQTAEKRHRNGRKTIKGQKNMSSVGLGDRCTLLTVRERERVRE